jgi:hypothetical protein
MSEAPAEAEELGSPIPDPPRRVPFAVAVTVVLLGFVSVFLLLIATLIVAASTNEPDALGQTLAEGLGAAAILAAAALVAALAWSFVRDGRTVGPMVVGCVVLLLGLLALGNGVIGDSPDPGLLRLSMVALTLGLGLLLVPLAGHGPAYLAARRVWSRAERDWLHEMATPVVAVPVTYPQQQWPGQYPPPPQPAQWGGYPGQPGYPPQYQYPPQPAQAWQAQPPQQYQAWPDPTAPAWVDPQQQFPGPPAQGQPSPAQPMPAESQQAQPFPHQPMPAESQQPVESPPAPPAAQQAPTEQIPTADPDAPRP